MSSLDLSRGNSQKNQPLGLQELEQRDRFIHRHIGPSEPQHNPAWRHSA